MSKSVQYITVSETGPDTVYIYLPGHPGKATKEQAGCVKEMIRLDDILADRNLATMVNFDFDENQCLIGIEVLL
ncbi:MAG: DUF2283 domain-containing protein [Pseudomonadota bacterium]